jgi:PTS system mannose-specific IIB component
MVKVLKMAAPSSIKVDIFNTHDAAVTLAGEDTGERVIILVKTPKTVLGLIKAGVNIADLNLGGMGATQGRKQLYRNISISAEEKAIFKELLTLGVDVFVQIVPDANKMPMATMI